MIKSIDITYDLNPLRTNMDGILIDICGYEMVFDMVEIESPTVGIIENKLVESLGLTWNDVFSDYPLVV